MKLKKDTTEALSFRIDKGLKRKLKGKYGRKLSAQVVPLLEKLCEENKAPKKIFLKCG